MATYTVKLKTVQNPKQPPVKVEFDFQDECVAQAFASLARTANNVESLEFGSGRTGRKTNA